MKVKRFLSCLFSIFFLSVNAHANRLSPIDSAYAIVNVSVCNMQASGKFAAAMTSQALLGTVVRVLQYNGWYEIRTPDDYTGWVHRMMVVPMSGAEIAAWKKDRKIVVTSHYGFTYEIPDEGGRTVSDVVAGNRLKWEGCEGDFYKVSYPDGRKAYLSKLISMPEKEWLSTLKRDVASIIRTAYTMMGIPYLWGGTSSKGVDCSGFVQTVFSMHGIAMPRDAWMQAMVGKRIDVVPGFDNVAPGDLVFFGRKATAGTKEEVSHVGIYVGDMKFIHSLGDVHVGSFRKEDKEYDAYHAGRLLFATKWR